MRSCIARLFLAAALSGVTLGAAAAQTSAAQGPKTPAELARAIADTVRASTHTPPGSPITLAAATSHDNVVEIAYSVTDAAMFARFKASAESSRLALVSHYCKESRRQFLAQGVVIHEVYALSDDSDQVEITIDKASCDSLPKTPVADAKTLAALALDAAKAENEAVRGGAGLAVRFARATAHEGVLELLFTVVDPATAQQNLRSGVATMAGFYCSKYLGAISQGLALHLILAPASGPPISEFTLDRTKC